MIHHRLDDGSSGKNKEGMRLHRYFVTSFARLHVLCRNMLILGIIRESENGSYILILDI